MNGRPGLEPSKLTERWRSKDGTEVTIRPICADDAGLEIGFLQGLSKDTLYQRALAHRGLLPGELKRLTQIDFDREAALVATCGAGSDERLIAVARYVKDADATQCEFAIVVADHWQRHGLGGKLLGSLVAVAAASGIRRMVGYTFATNEAMKGLSRKLGFTARPDPGDRTATVLTKEL